MVGKTRERCKRGLVISLMAVCFFLIIFSFYLSFFKPVHVTEFDVLFMVDSGFAAGFDLGTDALRFGSVSPGGSVTRTIDVRNDYNLPLRVDVSLSRNLIGLIDAERSFVVFPGENKTIPIKLNIPKDFADGNYTGKIRLEMYKID